MGFFDKLKGVANFVTGGAAKVTIEWQPHVAMPGEPLHVRVTATSTGPTINSQGVFVDVAGHEQLNIPANALGNQNPHISHNRQTIAQTFQIAGPLQLGANETRVFEGQIQLPPHAQPTYDGPFADHDWGIRGRLEMTGNDPDSGYLKFIVGKRG